MKASKLNVVFGGQAGSEAKGKQGAFLADKYAINHYASNMSPNAGHTWVSKAGAKVVTHHIPASIMGSWVRDETLGNVKVVVGPAAVINPSLFMKELGELEKLGLKLSNVIVDSRAAIILTSHVITEERRLTDIGSTAQGVGVARVDKLMRRGARASEFWGDAFTPFTIMPNTSLMVTSWMDGGKTVLYEASQGFDLCIDHGVDPTYCTSRQVSPQACLADAGVPASYLGDTYAVIRTYPIRVNNRTGSSGPYPSGEINWGNIKERCGATHDLTEVTTTTKLPRRVFEFSHEQIAQMVRVCNPTFLCLQFVNYWDWEAYGSTEVTPMVSAKMEQVEELSGKAAAYMGTSERHDGMIDRGLDRWR